MYISTVEGWVYIDQWYVYIVHWGALPHRQRSRGRERERERDAGRRFGWARRAGPPNTQAAPARRCAVRISLPAVPRAPRLLVSKALTHTHTHTHRSVPRPGPGPTTHSIFGRCVCVCARSVSQCAGVRGIDSTACPPGKGLLVYLSTRGPVHLWFRLYTLSLSVRTAIACLSAGRRAVISVAISELWTAIRQRGVRPVSSVASPLHNLGTPRPTVRLSVSHGALDTTSWSPSCRCCQWNVYMQLKLDLTSSRQKDSEGWRARPPREDSLVPTLGPDFSHGPTPDRRAM